MAAGDTPGFLLGGVRGHLYRRGQITPRTAPPKSRPAGAGSAEGKAGGRCGGVELQVRRVQGLGAGLPEGEFRLPTYDLCDLDQLTGFQKPQLPHL